MVYIGHFGRDIWPVISNQNKFKNKNKSRSTFTFSSCVIPYVVGFLYMRMKRYVYPSQCIASWSDNLGYCTVSIDRYSNRWSNGLTLLKHSTQSAVRESESALWNERDILPINRSITPLRLQTFSSSCESFTSTTDVWSETEQGKNR